MNVWSRYSSIDRKTYIQYLKVYGALTNLFKQKKGKNIPYLDSKYQETVYSKIFCSKIVDNGNTPHDVLSTFGCDRIGIGIKTWMNSSPSFQKVMQIKSYQSEISRLTDQKKDEIALKISQIKNDKLLSDYKRLGLQENNNIYHYVTRDKNSFSIYETSYPLINLNGITNVKKVNNTLLWEDGIKKYKYTFSDSQIWLKFGDKEKDTEKIFQFDISVIDDPFKFILDAYQNLYKNEESNDMYEVYLPLYSFRSKEVEQKSGLNSWNGAPKNKGSNTQRPLHEMYIPIPMEFHKKYSDFFCVNILKIIDDIKNSRTRDEVRFHLELPNGKRIPALLTGDGMKNLQSGSLTELDENGKHYGQDALAKWLFFDVLRLEERELMSRNTLKMKGVDSVKLWRKKDDFKTIFIDIAPYDSFEIFMQSKINN